MANNNETLQANNNEKSQIARLRAIDFLVAERDNSTVSMETFSRAVSRLSKRRCSTATLAKDIKKINEILNETINNSQIDKKLLLTNSGRKGYKYVDHNGENIDFRLYEELNEDEYKMLNFSKTLFNIFGVGTINNRFERILSKTFSGGKLDKTNKDFIKNALYFHNQPSTDISNKLNKILEHWFNGDCIEVIYRNEKGITSTKNICPYVLRHHNNNWYIVGFDHDCKRDRKTNVFDIHNIVGDIKISGRKYIVDPEFNAKDYFKYSLSTGIWHDHYNAPIEVTLKIKSDNTLNKLTKKPFNATQIESKENRTITFKVFQSPELTATILSLGDEVKVLAPKSLVSSIKEQYVAVLKQYK
jgi:hypothetical protein